MTSFVLETLVLLEPYPHLSRRFSPSHKVDDIHKVGLSSMIHQAGYFARLVLNNPWTVGILGWCSVFVPILGKGNLV